MQPLQQIVQLLPSGCRRRCSLVQAGGRLRRVSGGCLAPRLQQVLLLVLPLPLQVLLLPRLQVFLLPRLQVLLLLLLLLLPVLALLGQHAIQPSC
jgi:hypothetical protein